MNIFLGFASNMVKPMPRLPRIFFPEAIYHVSARGNDQQILFVDAQDHRVYRHLLELAKKTDQLRIFRWTQMSNHVHFMAQQINEFGLATAMQRVQAAYARYFNKRYGKSGHVWQGRYWARLLKSNVDLLTCGRYIERNPVEAGMVENPADYPWSSCRFYTQGHRNDLIDRDPAFEGLAQTEESRKAAWKLFLETPQDYKKPKWKLARVLCNPRLSPNRA